MLASLARPWSLGFTRCCCRSLRSRSSVPTPVRWFIVDASAITDVDYSAAQSIRDLLDELARRGVHIVFARVSPYLRSDMDRHHITAAVGEKWVFTTLHEAIAAVRLGRT
jgi:sulfate permease, SulP family